MQVATKYYKDYSGGLNDTSSPSEIARIEASLLRNWDITYQGQLKRRAGLTQVGNTIGVNPITGLGCYIRDNGSDLLSAEGTNLWYLSGATWLQLANNLIPDDTIAMENVQALNRLYIASEGNTPRYWDRVSTTINTALTTVTNGGQPVPSGNVMRWFQNFMFIFNNATLSGTKYPHRVYISNLGNPNLYTTASDYFDVPGDGRLITAVDAGVGVNGSEMVLFKERSIQILTGYGTNTWKITSDASSNYNVDQQIGCVARRGAVRVDNEIWFIDNQAQIRKLGRTQFGSLGQGIMSTKIRGTLAGLNQSQLEKTVAWYHANKVYFAFPNGSDTTNSILCVYDLIAASRTQQEAWTTYTGWFPSIFSGQLTSGVPALYMGDARTGKVYKHEGPDDAGVAIDARYDSKDDNYDLPFQFKRFIMGYIRGFSGSGSGSVQNWASVDGGPYGQMEALNLAGSGSTLGPTGSFLLGPTGNNRLGGGTVSEQKYYYTTGGGSAEGKTMKVSIRHNVAGQQPTVNAYSAHFKPRQLR